MSYIIAERRINDAFRTKSSLSTHYLIITGDPVRVFREASKAWDGTFIAMKGDIKVINVTDKVK